MDQFSEVTRATVEALLRDYTLWITILSLVLLFALYVKLFPTPLSGEFFADGPTTSASTNKKQDHSLE
jgi:hypothetical protein